MKYRVYSNGKSYILPTQSIASFGDKVSARAGGQFSLLGGETLYIEPKQSDCINLSLKSGNEFIAYYTMPGVGSIHTGHGSLYDRDDLYDHDNSILRIWNVGTSIYDFRDYFENKTGEQLEFSEEELKAGGAIIIGTIIYNIDSDGNGYWRLIDPTPYKYGGQYFVLETVVDTLYISGEAGVHSENGLYYTFESGTEGVGYYIRDNQFICQTCNQYFGDCTPQEGDTIKIFHCGRGLYEYFEEIGKGTWDWALSQDGLNVSYNWCYTEFGEPFILVFNDGKWILQWEGDINEF